MQDILKQLLNLSEPGSAEERHLRGLMGLCRPEWLMDGYFLEHVRANWQAHEHDATQPHPFWKHEISQEDREYDARLARLFKLVYDVCRPSVLRVEDK